MKTFLNKIVIIMVIVTFGTVSCNDFLTEHPNGKMTAEMVFTKKEDLYSAQYALQERLIMLTKHALTFIPMFAGDDVATHSASNKWAMREFDVMTVSDQNAYMVNSNTGNWTNLWKVIKASNYNINYADKAIPLGAPQADVDAAKGVGYFWRAYCYYYLVRVWGPLPLVLDSDEMDLESKIYTVAEVYDQIVSDLKEAESLLPAKYTVSPWALNGTNVLPGKGAAQSVLSSVYMSMAGWPLNYGNDYYKLCADKAKEVIDGCDNGTYYYKMYEYTGENTGYCQIHSRAENWRNQEAILYVPYSEITGTGDDSQSARGSINDIHDCSGGYNDVVAEIGYWIDFPDGDRKEWTYAPVTFVRNESEAFPWWHEKIPPLERQPTSRKSAFTQWDNAAHGNDEYNHWMAYGDQSGGWSLQARQLMRISEVYLFYAEAMFRQGIADAKAVELLNKVRNRANGSLDSARDIYNVGMGAPALAEHAYNEHGWEVACWYPSIASRYSDQHRMFRLKDHYELRKRYQDLDIKYNIMENGAVVASLRELYGPVEPWSDTKMYATYPAPDKRMVRTLAEADNNKLNLIKP